MRKSIRILIALVAGILLVFGAFYISKKQEPAPSGEIVTAPVPSRENLETRDLDNNGIADWKEGLDGLAFETINTPPINPSKEDSEEYVPPTTFTGKFSVAFLQDYLSGKTKGVSFDDPTTFANSAVEAIERNTASKKHSRLEFTIVENTPEALRDYGNTLVAIVRAPSVDSNKDLEIVRDALQADDQEMLEGLVPIREAYSQAIAGMLAMRVPEHLSEIHVDLLNAYEAMYSNLDAMMFTLSDPLYALARIRNYMEDSREIVIVVKTITDILTANGIVYAKDELGSQLYLFDI